MPEETTTPAVETETTPTVEETSTAGGVKEFQRAGKNQYFVNNFKSKETQTINFYELEKDGSTLPGTTVEELLRLCAERLGDLNNNLPNDFTVNAINKIREALSQLHARTADRTTRGVEGTHQE